MFQFSPFFNESVSGEGSSPFPFCAPPTPPPHIFFVAFGHGKVAGLLPSFIFCQWCWFRVPRLFFQRTPLTWSLKGPRTHLGNGEFLHRFRLPFSHLFRPLWSLLFFSLLCLHKSGLPQSLYPTSQSPFFAPLFVASPLPMISRVCVSRRWFAFPWNLAKFLRSTPHCLYCPLRNLFSLRLENGDFLPMCHPLDV